MTLQWKLVIDCSDPHAQADFWAAALGYEVEDNSPLIEQLLGQGAIPAEITVEAHGRRAWRDAAGARHPDDPFDASSGAGLGRRLLFNRVPEAKTGKNRLHIDLHAGGGRRPAEVARLEGLGATFVRDVKEQGGQWALLQDPEGNEFCVA
ncbi:Glyoxalase-like domain protein [Streptomyces sp. YIM 130001]|uniref:VOC family protein n=1 Tax=Streptomyces sp. YIM 130001 TaxID=2259644 RepID=UPI000E64DA66|nr:VOC family protein [Streptomyces sp. YIM 130001]RII22213.1 Glyoxalase-like domain protein [Streptomyces sp. YIM 130001]